MSKEKQLSGEEKVPKPNLHYVFVEKIIIHQLTGEILTIIDSAIVESKQNKAIKDLIKSRIRSCVAKIQTRASGIDSDGKNTSWGHSINFPE